MSKAKGTITFTINYLQTNKEPTCTYKYETQISLLKRFEKVSSSNFGFMKLSF